MSKDVMSAILAFGGGGSGKLAIVISWDGTATPVVANIPSGVVVTYQGTEYTGTLAASAQTEGKMYMVAKSQGSGLDNYEGYTTFKSGASYYWEAFEAKIDLSGYVSVSSQSFTEPQKAQARTNIGAGEYSKPAGGIPDSDLAEAHYTESEVDTLLNAKVAVAQGVAHAGEFLVVGNDGNVTTNAIQQASGNSF